MPSGTPQDAADQVKNMVRQGAKNITDNLTLKPQRQAISDFVDSAEKRIKSYLPGSKPSGPVTSKQKPVWGDPKSMKKGGVVKKTGLVKMHAGERVIPVKSAAKKKGK